MLHEQYSAAGFLHAVLDICSYRIVLSYIYP